MRHPGQPAILVPALKTLQEKVRQMEKILPLLDKYKYLLLVVGVGLLLMLWPTGEARPPEQTAQAPPDFSVSELEERIAGSLGKIEGVGRVEIVLTLKTGVETIYQTNEQTRTQQDQDNGNTTRYQSERSQNALVLSGGGGNQQPVAVKQNYPEFLGALVVCDGAENSAVAWQVVNAVTALTGIPSDRITVAKMKNSEGSK